VKASATCSRRIRASRAGSPLWSNSPAATIPGRSRYRRTMASRTIRARRRGNQSPVRRRVHGARLGPTTDRRRICPLPGHSKMRPPPGPGQHRKLSRAPPRRPGPRVRRPGRSMALPKAPRAAPGDRTAATDRAAAVNHNKLQTGSGRRSAVCNVRSGFPCSRRMCRSEISGWRTRPARLGGSLLVRL
jgi:hypothetical protein